MLIHLNFIIKERQRGNSANTSFTFLLLSTAIAIILRDNSRVKIARCTKIDLNYVYPRCRKINIISYF